MMKQYLVNAKCYAKWLGDEWDPDPEDEDEASEDDEDADGAGEDEEGEDGPVKTTKTKIRLVKTMRMQMRPVKKTKTRPVKMKMYSITIKDQLRRAKRSRQRNLPRLVPIHIFYCLITTRAIGTSFDEKVQVSSKTR
jgi:hypothetical protein